MPLPQGRIFLPARYTSEDLAQQNQYQNQIDDYNALYDQYKTDLDAYNEQIKRYNEGPRLEDFTGVAPTAPGQPGVTQEEIDQFNQDAEQRATSNRNMMTTALNVARNPEAYGFGGFGFQYGGVVPMQQGIASLQQPVPSIFPQYFPR